MLFISKLIKCILVFIKMTNLYKILFVGITCSLFYNVNSQEVINLWGNEEIPYYKANNLKEYKEEAYGTTCIFNVTKPTLTIYKAQGENKKKAVVIIPGGGYGLVAMYHEGYDLAKKLSENGITAAVLKYRLPDTVSSNQPQKVPLADARRALKLLRQKANDYGFVTNKVGVMGFSAGSHLAAVLGLWRSENVEENPNFTVLIYGVSRLSEENLKWLEESLYYRKLSASEIEQNTLLNLISGTTPPAFLVHAYDDDICKVEESTLYAEKLRECSIPVEMHLFENGGHGFGMGRKSDGTSQWPDLFISWLDNNF